MQKLTGPAWKPSHSQRAVLTLAILYPRLDKLQLAKQSGVSKSSIFRWFAEEDFRRWWNQELLDNAPALAGPAMRELQAIIENKKVRPQDRVKAIECLLEQVRGAGGTKQAAVLAFLAAYKGAPPGSELRVASGQDANGQPAFAGAFHKPNPEVLELEAQGEELGALRASVSTERVAARISAQVRLAAGLDAEHLEQASSPSPVSAPPVIPPAPQWRSRRLGGKGLPASPAHLGKSVRRSDPENGVLAQAGTDSEEHDSTLFDPHPSAPSPAAKGKA